MSRIFVAGLCIAGLLLALVVLLALLFWWLMRRRPQAQVQVAAAVPAPPPPPEPAPPAEPAPPPAPDDLKLIEGIGPKISELLQAAGITTFAQLAATDVERLREILLQAGLRIADPTTWSEQARLAAAGDWEAFERLLGELKGGRRVESD